MSSFPHSKIGIIGGGQLGRMFILECRRMNIYTVVLDSDPYGPAAQVANKTYHPEDVISFIRDCDVATYEFEHIDISLIKEIEKKIPLCPSSLALEIKQSRISEKTFLKDKGFPVPDFYIIKDPSEIYSIKPKLPLVLKKAKGGYDGKGLYIINSLNDLAKVRQDLKSQFLAEDYVPYIKELSIICARDAKGREVFYPIVENVHKEGILLYSISPAKINKKTEKKIHEIASSLARSLDIVGLIVVEMFLTQDEEIFINEFAPRPHNSGHYSLDACDISQFEMLFRIICNLPITKPRLLCPSAMLNIIGKGADEIPFKNILSLPGIKLHMYGKKDARPGRKMGHINILGETTKDVKELLKNTMTLVYNTERF